MYCNTISQNWNNLLRSGISFTNPNPTQLDAVVYFRVLMFWKCRIILNMCLLQRQSAIYYFNCINKHNSTADYDVWSRIYG